jgi:hypothetical protein
MSYLEKMGVIWPVIGLEVSYHFEAFKLRRITAWQQIKLRWEEGFCHLHSNCEGLNTSLGPQAALPTA